jgi:hypothetical protein
MGIKIIRAIATSLMIGLFIISAIPLEADIPKPVKEGNKVFIDIPDAYISAMPHTMGSPRWVEFEFKTKKYEGNVDVAWGFSENDIIVKDLQMWEEDAVHIKHQPYQANELQFVTIENIVKTKILEAGTSSADLGNDSNTKLIEITTASAKDSPVKKNLFVLAYTSSIQNNETSISFYYYTTVTKTKEIKDIYPDWVKATKTKFKQEKTLVEGNISEWSYKTCDTPIQKNKTYKIRCWIELPFKGTERVSGEYYFAIKPSDETIAEAKASGNLHILDPWYDQLWLYKVEIPIDNSASSENLTDFPYLDTCNSTNFNFSQPQADGDDIRYTDGDGNGVDTLTLLDYFHDDWDNVGEASTSYVKIPQIDAGSTTDSIFKYWGNSSAVNTEAPDRVFGDWETMTNCEDGIGWYGTVSGAGSITMALDSTTVYEGIYSIKSTITGGANDSYRIEFEPASGCNWDFSANGSALDFWFRADTANTSFTSSKVYMYDDEGDYIWWYMNYGANTWTEMIKHENNYANKSGGIFDASCVESILIEINDDPAGTNFNFWVDQIEHRWGALLAGIYKDSTTSTINDATRYNNTGTFKGANEPLWSQLGDQKWVVHFDGSDDYIIWGQPVAYDNLAQISTQMYTSPDVADPAAMWFDRDNLVNRSLYQGQSNQNVVFVLWSGAAGTTSITATNPITIGGWQQLDCTYDGSNQYIYVDGTQEDITAMTGTIDDTNNAWLSGMTSSGGDRRWYDGYIGHYRLYSYGLSADWIEANHLSMTNQLGTYGTVQGQPSAPLTFTSTVTGTTAITLDWATGNYTENVTILRRTDAFPVSVTDGVVVYTGNTTVGTYIDNATDPSERKYYYALYPWSEWGHPTDYLTTSAGGVGLAFLGFVGFCAILSLIAFKSSFFGLKLMAGMSWFAFWIWVQGNPPFGITEGSGEHTALLVISAGFGLMIVLAGLGRGIQRTKRWSMGDEQTMEGFSWKLPNWMNASKDTPEERTKGMNDSLDAYRAELRKAYRRKTK